MLLSYGAFLFCAYLSLACRRGQNKYPPLPRGINIYSSRCRGRDSKDCFSAGCIFFWPSGAPAPTGVQREPLHCGRRPLRVFSGNLCMRADVGFGPYEGNGPYPKG